MGGGLYASAQSNLNLSGNLFSGNFAVFSGGGAYLDAGEFIVSDNEFIGNSSGGEGGGAYVVSEEFIFDKMDTIVTNNIFAKNSCAGKWGGGATFSSFDRLTLTNNTFTLNSTDRFGSALVIDNVPYSFGDVPTSESIITNIYNNIVIANDIVDGSDILVRTYQLPIPTPPPPGVTPSPVTIDYGTVNFFNNDVAVFNVEITSECGFSEYNCLLEINEGNNIDEDPLFLDAEAGDVSLQPDSPCIDSGDPNAPDVPDTDIFGNPRIPPPDMGAVEFIELVVDGEAGGGCSIAHMPASSSLAVFLVIPVLILIRRVVKRYRS